MCADRRLWLVDTACTEDDATIAAACAHRETGDELGASMRELRHDLIRPPSPQARRQHLAAMRRAAAETPPAVRRSRRALMMVSAATVGIVALTSGLAAAGHLPDPVQDRVARIAETVGIKLPGDHPRDHPTPSENDGVAPTSPETRSIRGTPPAGEPAGPRAAESSRRSSKSTPTPSNDLPGTSGTTPSDGGNPANEGGTAGNSGNTPGQDNPPSQGGAPAPGNSGNAPGQGGTPPGQVKKSERPGDAAGQSGSAPGQARDAAAQ